MIRSNVDTTISRLEDDGKQRQRIMSAIASAGPQDVIQHKQYTRFQSEDPEEVMG